MHEKRRIGAFFVYRRVYGPASTSKSVGMFCLRAGAPEEQVRGEVAGTTVAGGSARGKPRSEI